MAAADGRHARAARRQVGDGDTAYCMSGLVGGGPSGKLVLGDIFLRAFYSVYTYEPVSKAAWVGLASSALAPETLSALRAAQGPAQGPARGPAQSPAAAAAPGPAGAGGSGSAPAPAPAGAAKAAASGGRRRLDRR